MVAAAANGMRISGIMSNTIHQLVGWWIEMAKGHGGSEKGLIIVIHVRGLATATIRWRITKWINIDEEDEILYVHRSAR